MPDLADVRGHNALIPALEVAAAGGHNLFLQGPPGHRQDDARAPAAVDPAAAGARRGDRGHAHPVVAGLRGGAGLVTRAAVPRAAPHDLGRRPGRRREPARSPGEATLAHRGVLFLDELSEFARPSLEALRQPLEDGHVTIVRGQQVMAFPTRFMLVAASNPCPCGLGRATRCRCTQADLARHRRRLSRPAAGPHRHPDARRAPAVGRAARRSPRRRRRRSASAWSPPASARRSASPATAETCNAQLTLAPDPRGRPAPRRARCACSTSSTTATRLSARGHTRILRVARTVADLDGSRRRRPASTSTSPPSLRLETTPAALAEAA